MIGTTLTTFFAAQALAVVAVAIAFLSLFFKGYRYIFVGFILSAPIGSGLAYLAWIIIYVGSVPRL